MPIKRIAHYKKSFERDNTLAAANLAYELLNSGFADEAVEILDEANEKDDVHPNIGSARAAVGNRKEAESKTEIEALEASREQRQFMLAFAEAYFESPSTNPQFEGPWHFPDGVEATITRNNDELKIKWTLGDKERVMNARVRNRGARITKYSRQDGYLPTSLGDKGYAYLSQNNDHMNIMVLKGNRPSFLTLERPQ